MNEAFAEINTPPPNAEKACNNTVPMPKGRMHVCTVMLEEIGNERKEKKTEVVAKSVAVGVKRERDEEDKE